MSTHDHTESRSPESNGRNPQQPESEPKSKPVGLFLPGMGELAEDGSRRICNVCKKRLATPNRSTCSICRERSNTALKKMRSKRQSKGLCYTCGKPNDNGLKYCNDCAIKSRDYHKSYKKRNREEGKCTRCGKPPLSGKSLCDDCIKVDKRLRRKYSLVRWSRVLFKNIKFRSQRLGMEIDIDEEYILEMYREQNGLCYWFGIQMVPSSTPKDPRKPSVDRLDGTKGYTKGNVVLTCLAANFSRNNCEIPKFTPFSDSIKHRMSDVPQWLAWSRIIKI